MWPAARRTVALCLLLIGLAWHAPLAAQSFLGTIRGTVVDPQGAAVSGAAVLIVDEATGVPRTLETDAQGRYEAANLQPGTYRVEVVTHELQEGREDRRAAARRRHRAGGHRRSKLGGVNETVTVSADAINNITLDSQAIARGLDEQQLRDLPRN